MGYMLKVLVIPIDGIRIDLKYCSNQPVLLYIPGGGGYIVYDTRYPGGGQMLLGGVSQFIEILKYHRLFFITLGDEKSSEAK